MRKPKVPDNYCEIHLIPLSSTLDPSNMFCLTCEKELESAPKKKVKSSDGFKIPPAPKGVNPHIYYAVVEYPWEKTKPQFAYIFKSGGIASKEVKNRAAADSSVEFIAIRIETETKCVHWFNSGMSRDTYAIWLPQSKPKVVNGNHAVYVKKLNSKPAPGHYSAGKLKTPQYTGSRSSPRQTIPVPAKPKSTPSKAVGKGALRKR